MDFSACSIRGGGSRGRVELIFPRRKLKSNPHAWETNVTVLNLDLKPVFLRSVFIVCYLVYFILTVMYFRFLLNI